MKDEYVLIEATYMAIEIIGRSYDINSLKNVMDEEAENTVAQLTSITGKTYFSKHVGDRKIILYRADNNMKEFVRRWEIKKLPEF